MIKHKNNKVNDITSHFTYYEHLFIGKKLDNDSSKLKEIIYASKLTISSLEKENKNQSEKIDYLREKYALLIQNSHSPYPSYVNFRKSIKCEKIQYFRK